MTTPWRIACVLLTACADHQARAACPDAEIVSPPKASIQADARPPIVWKALPGVDRYRVQVESRVPNGRVLARIDNQVAATQFLPSQALTDQQAVVKVRVTAACPEEAQATVSEMGPWFFVDVRALCGEPEEIAIRAATPAVAQWKPASNALKTEVAVFSASDGSLLAREEVDGDRRELPATAQPYLVALRSRCKETFSKAAYRVVAPAAR